MPALRPVDALLASYPRARPPLSEAMQKQYLATYTASREGKGLFYAITQYLESWMHRKISALQNGGNVLEIGAGTLNHLQYEKHHSSYDIIEPFTELYSGKPELQGIRNIYRDISDIPEGTHYGRIISVATLEHLTELPDALAASCKLLSKDGVFQAGIPSEGGFLWGATWRASVGLNFRIKTGLDYGELMRHEHVNRADEIIQLVRHFFHEVRISRFPLPHGHLSLYAYIEARKPKLSAS